MGNPSESPSAFKSRWCMLCVLSSFDFHPLTSYRYITDQDLIFCSLFVGEDSTYRTRHYSYFLCVHLWKMTTTDQIQGEMELGYQHTLVSYCLRLGFVSFVLPLFKKKQLTVRVDFLIALYVNGEPGSVILSTSRPWIKQKQKLVSLNCFSCDFFFF